MCWQPVCVTLRSWTVFGSLCTGALLFILLAKPKLPTRSNVRLSSNHGSHTYPCAEPRTTPSYNCPGCHFIGSCIKVSLASNPIHFPYKLGWILPSELLVVKKVLMAQATDGMERSRLTRVATNHERKAWVILLWALTWRDMNFLCVWVAWMTGIKICFRASTKCILKNELRSVGSLFILPVTKCLVLLAKQNVIDERVNVFQLRTIGWILVSLVWIGGNSTEVSTPYPQLV